jgi:prevent-host-death family protein
MRPIQEARQRFSEMIRAVEREGPQIVIRHGEDVAVIVDIAEYRGLTSPATDLMRVLLGPPRLDDAAAVPLDQLEEHGRPVLERPGEDLQQVAVLVPVGQHAEFAQLADMYARLTDPRAELVAACCPTIPDRWPSYLWRSHSAQPSALGLAERREPLVTGRSGSPRLLHAAHQAGSNDRR